MIYDLKRNLNTDGHQFHQYQQSQQSPLILSELKKDHDIWRWKSRSWDKFQAFKRVLIFLIFLIFWQQH